MSRLIIISGHPATGKTTISKEVAKLLGVSLIARDAYKEALFDSLGWDNRETSRKYGVASYELLYLSLEVLLDAGVDCVVESNFVPEYANDRFSAYKEKYGLHFVQIICTTEPSVLIDRFQKRYESGERHPGHVDGENLESIKKIALTKLVPFSHADKVIYVDTTSFDVDVPSLVKEIIK